MHIYRFGKVDSTNTEARKYPAGSVLIAEEQTAGKGRFDRDWSSGKGGVYMSIVVKAETDNAKYYTFIAAIAAQHAMKKVADVDAKIKWPNDLIFEEKKLCGILTENYVKDDEMKMIIGIGINTNNDIPGELKEAVSVKAYNTAVIDALLGEFIIWMDKSKEAVLAEWRKLSHTLGRKVRVESMGEVIEGTAEDIDEDCNLIVEGKKIIEGDILNLPDQP